MIRVSNLQKGNSLLEHLVKTSWHFDASTVADYEINNSAGVVFLSLRFHICKPDYITKRLRKCANKYKTRVMLLQVDIKNYEPCIEEIFSLSFGFDFTLVLSFGSEESARYIRALDINGTRRVESLAKKIEDAHEKFISAFPKLNKNDVTSIKGSFANIRSFLNAKVQDLENINGMGKVKAQILKKYAEMDFKG